MERDKLREHHIRLLIKLIKGLDISCIKDIVYHDTGFYIFSDNIDSYYICNEIRHVISKNKYELKITDKMEFYLDEKYLSTAIQDLELTNSIYTAFQYDFKEDVSFLDELEIQHLIQYIYPTIKQIEALNIPDILKIQFCVERDFGFYLKLEGVPNTLNILEVLKEKYQWLQPLLDMLDLENYELFPSFKLNKVRLYFNLNQSFIETRLRTFKLKQLI